MSLRPQGPLRLWPIGSLAVAAGAYYALGPVWCIRVVGLLFLLHAAHGLQRRHRLRRDNPTESAFYLGPKSSLVYFAALIGLGAAALAFAPTLVCLFVPSAAGCP